MRSTRLPGRPLDSRSRRQGRRHQPRSCKSSKLLAIPLLAAMALAHALPITFNDFYDPVSGAGNLWLDTTASGASLDSVTLGSGAAMTSVIFSSPTFPAAYLLDGLLAAKPALASVMSGASAASSDFPFIDSTLTVTANRRSPFSPSAPEPATLALIALGLFGMNWSPRKKS